MFDFLKPTKDNCVTPTPTASADLMTKADKAEMLDRLHQLDFQLRELQRTLVRVETKLCITADALGVGDKITRKRSY